MTWTAAYWRHRVRHEEDFEEEHEAVNFLMFGEEYGELTSEGITRDGWLVYDKPSLYHLFEQLDWEPMPPTIDGVAAPAIKAIGP